MQVALEVTKLQDGRQEDRKKHVRHVCRSDIHGSLLHCDQLENILPFHLHIASIFTLYNL